MTELKVNQLKSLDHKELLKTRDNLNSVREYKTDKNFQRYAYSKSFNTIG